MARNTIHVNVVPAIIGAKSKWRARVVKPIAVSRENANKPKQRPDPSHSVQHHYPGVFACAVEENENRTLLQRVTNGS